MQCFVCYSFPGMVRCLKSNVLQCCLTFLLCGTFCICARLVSTKDSHIDSCLMPDETFTKKQQLSQWQQRKWIYAVNGLLTDAKMLYTDVSHGTKCVVMKSENRRPDDNTNVKITFIEFFPSVMKYISKSWNKTTNSIN